MTINLYIEHLVNAKTLSKVKTLLKDLAGIDVKLLDLSGQIITHKETSSNTLTPPSKIRKSNKKELKFEDLKILENISEHKKTHIYLTKDGLKKIIVPVVFRDNVIGFLYTGETAACQLIDMQINSIAKFLEHMLEEVNENNMKQYENFKGNSTTHQRKIINKAVNYIEKNYHSPKLSLSEVSEENGISYHHLSRLFKKELNTNFSMYLNKVRVNVASSLLRDQSLSVSQVSYSCGFEDPSYFCKVFKRTRGTTPAKYRNTATSV